jgi:hypothetical protein
MLLHTGLLGSADQVVVLRGVPTEQVAQCSLLLQLEAQLRAEDEFVLFEQTAVDPREHRDANGFAQGHHTLLGRVGRLGTSHRLHEERHECLQRELVHVIDQHQLDQQEIQPSTFARHEAELVTSRVDRNLLLLGQFDLLFDLRRRLLGLLQSFNERHIAEDVVRRVGQALKQLVLQVGQRHHVVVDGAHESRASLFQLGLLLVHHQGQQLVLQSFLRHDEVHQRRLCGNLRTVVRVGELGLQEQSEVVVVRHFVRSNLDDLGTAGALDDRTGHDRIDGRLQLLADTLEQHGVTGAHGGQQRLQPAFLKKNHTRSTKREQHTFRFPSDKLPL